MKSSYSFKISAKCPGTQLPVSNGGPKLWNTLNKWILHKNWSNLVKKNSDFAFWKITLLYPFGDTKMLIQMKVIKIGAIKAFLFFYINAFKMHAFSCIFGHITNSFIYNASDQKKESIELQTLQSWDLLLSFCFWVSLPLCLQVSYLFIIISITIY